jgi:hypothetical protein
MLMETSPLSRLTLSRKAITSVFLEKQSSPDGQSTEVIRNSLEVTEKELRKIISTIPDTVDKAYEAILAKSTNIKRAQKLLHIVVAAVRPLTLKEMNVALEIEDSSKLYEDLDLEKETSFETTVKNLCGLFVSVIDRKIYLIHQTAKEFLVARKGIASLGIWKYSLETTESELILTKICISYLLFTIFDSDPLLIGVGASGYDVKENINQYTNEHGFLDYAAKHWAIHYQRAQAMVDTATLELNFSICNVKSKRFLTWFQVYWTSVANYSRCPQNFTSLMTASYLGHETVVGLLLEKDVDLEARDESHGQTPLSFAARYGHEAVVKLLVEKGAELETKSKCYRTPLSLAAENGHKAVVKLLVEKGAELETKSKKRQRR